MILGYTQLLIRGEEKGSQRHDDLRTIEKHARTCKTIVERPAELLPQHRKPARNWSCQRRD